MNLGDKLVRLRGDQGKGLVWVRALRQPRKPLWVGPRSVHEIWKDLANWLDSNFLSRERCDPAWKAGLFGRDEPSQPRPVPAHRD
jgi:hypothetical protein